MPTTPVNPPRKPALVSSPAFFRRQDDVLDTKLEFVVPPLPADWDQLDLDQQVRTLGEW